MKRSQTRLLKNWTPVSRVTGGDTNHYTTENLLRFGIVHSELISDLEEDFVKIESLWSKNNSVLSPAGNWTPVSRVTGGDTNHYTTEDLLRFGIVHSELISDLEEDFVKIQSLWSKNDLVLSPAGNWTPVSRVTGRDTNHYTTEDLLRFGIVHIELISDLKQDFLKIKNLEPNIIQSSPRRGIEPRSPAWQAGILTTILPRTCWDLESSILSWLVSLDRIFLKYKIWMQK